jgi:hypothetical protein
MSKLSNKLWDKFNGDIAVIEDGSVILYGVRRDMERGYGVERITRTPTTVRAGQSNIDPSLFPLQVTFDFAGHYLLVPGIANQTRKVHIDKKLIQYELGATEKHVLPEKDLTDKESEKRWYYLRQMLNSEDRLFVAVASSRLPRKSKEMFVSWADAVARGSNEDEATDFLYDKFGTDLANDFLRATRLSNGWKFTPRHSPPSSMVFMLDGQKSKYAPLAIYGEIPEIDWANLPW